MVSASLISASNELAGCPEEIYEGFQQVCEEMVLEPVRSRFDEEVFTSEMETNSNNRSIAAELAARGIISESPESAVDVYTRCCSMQTTTEDAAVMAAAGELDRAIEVTFKLLSAT
jgi:glutaminase